MSLAERDNRHNDTTPPPPLLRCFVEVILLCSCPPVLLTDVFYVSMKCGLYTTTISKGRAGSPRVVTGGVCMLSAPPCKRVRKVSLSSVKYSTQYCQTLSQSSLKKEERNERKAMRGKEGRGGCGWCVVLSFSTPFCVHVCRDTGRRR